MSDFDLLVRGSEHDIGISEGKIVAIGDRTLPARLAKEIDAPAAGNFPRRASTPMSISTNQDAPIGKVSRPVRARPRPAEPPLSSTCRSTRIRRPSTDRLSMRNAPPRRKVRWSILAYGADWFPGNLDQLETLRDRGVVGLKAFMCNSGIDDFPHVDRAHVARRNEARSRTGPLVAVHAESNELTRERAPATGTARDFLDSRPVEAELRPSGRRSNSHTKPVAGCTSCM